ncbi:MFS transporter [Legionella spiritensis]|uniref:MFS transporter n=1 Tax=Legionella spiritensis TaxID=452 RepID=UPI000F6BFE25|nr:MFS transporter [Legionella spiritensis]VEG92307.1 major facilitator superfamily transporter [Legionella spiritensis]
MVKSKPGNPQSFIPKSVWVLGFVSLLMDISSGIIHSILPLFMVSTLGVSMIAIGFLEGVAEATALIAKVFSGVLSDYLALRKKIVIFGYALSALSKPLFAIAGSFHMVFIARFCDRIGKGVRDAPRDALIADLVSPEFRGRAFGLRQALDSVGAFLGPLFAVLLMFILANQFRTIFWIAFFPSVIAVVLLAYGVQEPRSKSSDTNMAPISRAKLKLLGTDYWWVTAIGAIFILARFSEAFLILRALESGMSLTLSPLVLVVMNIVYALSAYPFGKLADRANHYALLKIGLATLFLADIILANGVNSIVVLAGVSIWGVHMGMTQGLLATMVAKSAPPSLRGTAFGMFNLISGLAMLIASILAGYLWMRLGPAYTFYGSALFCLIAIAGIFWLQLTKQVSGNPT